MKYSKSPLLSLHAIDATCLEPLIALWTLPYIILIYFVLVHHVHVDCNYKGANLDGKFVRTYISLISGFGPSSLGVPGAAPRVSQALSAGEGPSDSASDSVMGSE